MPMVWGAWEEDKLQERLNKHIVPKINSGDVHQVLGFNEPDKLDQANMPYFKALEYWPRLEALGVPLCSPSCANSLSDVDDSTLGVRGTWMRDFMKAADKRGCRIDYIGVHWYGGPSPTAFKQRMIDIYKTYGQRPLLITNLLCRLGCKSTRPKLYLARRCSYIYAERTPLDGAAELDCWLCLVFIRNQ